MLEYLWLRVFLVGVWLMLLSPTTIVSIGFVHIFAATRETRVKIFQSISLLGVVVGNILLIHALQTASYANCTASREVSRMAWQFGVALSCLLGIPALQVPGDSRRFASMSAIPLLTLWISLTLPI